MRYITSFWILFALAVIANLFQLFSVNFAALLSTESMIADFQARAQTGFEGLIWSEQCVYQSALLDQFFASGTGEVVFSGINPVFFAEGLVLLLAALLVAIVTYSNPTCKPNWLDWTIGVFFGLALFIYDFNRYIGSSVFFVSANGDPKGLYTWSSYCFHGDLGWLFDVLGYLFMYGMLALGVSIFSRSVRGVYNEDAANMDTALNTVGRIYTWLPYFSYMGFAGWVTRALNFRGL
ncbi:hypothetical protein [uncultured Roseobacter sp.]|uniref:hypothetical protein n=1 Tax=uncultured Roseobacter sp. TaxID=114847 RepID=UPI002604554E|nr:hypothetical protein [uncultured Roseobacter sp.]